MATSQFPGNPLTIQTATAGALTGDGTSGSKLAVAVDGASIDINGSNQLEVQADANPAPGSTTQVIFNDSGVLGADTGLTFDKTTNVLSFLSAGGASFAGAGANPITVTGGDDGAGASALIFDNPTDDYVALKFPRYSSILIDHDGGFDLYSDVTTLGVYNDGVYVDFGQTTTAPDGLGAIHGDLRLSGGQASALYAYGIAMNATATAGSYGGTISGAGFAGKAIGVTAASVYGAALSAYASTAATVTKLGGVFLVPTVTGTGGTVTNWYGAYVVPSIAASNTVTNGYAYWSEDLSATNTTNAYYSWFDSRGVRRVIEAPSGQAIEALYNYTFTKYTPGAVNFERLVNQWGVTGTLGTTDRALIGVEKGGTGTQRGLDLMGADVSAITAAGAYAAFSAASYAVGSTAGIDATITSAGLVGKTITVSKGIITGFA